MKFDPKDPGDPKMVGAAGTSRNIATAIKKKHKFTVGSIIKGEFLPIKNCNVTVAQWVKKVL